MYFIVIFITIIFFFFPVNFKGKADFSLPNDIEKEIGPDAPINQRLRALKEYSEVVATNRLEDVSSKKII